LKTNSQHQKQAATDQKNRTEDQHLIAKEKAKLHETAASHDAAQQSLEKKHSTDHPENG
jgi:hypothetical protein